MKRKYATRPIWRRVKKRRFVMERLVTDDFCGVVTQLHLHEVNPELWVNGLGSKFCIAASGYSRIQFFPEGEPYAFTVMSDETSQPVQVYFDVGHHGLTEQGIPYWDDLYLDVIYLPKRGVELQDEDELELALASKAISQNEYHLAVQTAKHLMEQIQTGKFSFESVFAYCAHAKR